MDLTGRIAAVLGPALIVVTTSEAINLDIWTETHPTLVYLNGLLFLLGGLVVITNHNRWRLNGEALVTLCGWLLALTGAFRMVFPKAPQLEASVGTYGLIASLGAVGVALSIIAITRRKR